MTAQQLKNSILQMAVQGKLVPQDPNDEPASILLERIRAEKEQLIKEKKIKKEKNPSVIFRGADNLPYEKVGKNDPVCIVDEVPFDIPESWEWVRLTTLGEIVGGGTPKTNIPEYWDKGNIPWLTPADMKFVTGKYVDKGERCITGEGLKGSSAHMMPAGTIVYSSRAPIGYIAIASTELCTNQGFKSLVPVLTCIDDYVYYCLIAFTPEIQSRASGTTFKEISGAEFGKTLIPLPPLAEQQRIVKRIEDVLPALKMYDIKETALRKMNDDFPDKLRKSILQWAVQGKLVPQDPTDEPASILLEHIREEKQKLIREGKIKKDKHESVIFRRDNSHYEKLDGILRCIDDELPFEIPESWCWCKIRNIFTLQAGKNIQAAEIHENPFPGSYPCYGGNGIRGYVAIANRSGDYPIIGRQGALCGNINRGTGEFYATEHAVCVEIYSNVSVTWACLFLTALNLNQYATATAQPGLAVANINEVFIPLPPLNEQHRIVQKIKELLPLIKGL